MQDQVESVIENGSSGELRTPIFSKPPHGKWYVVFTWFDAYAGHWGDTQHEEVLLNATTEDEALAEAVSKATSGERVKTLSGTEIHIPEQYNVIYKIEM